LRAIYAARSDADRRPELSIEDAIAWAAAPRHADPRRRPLILVRRAGRPIHLCAAASAPPPRFCAPLHALAAAADVPISNAGGIRFDPVPSSGIGCRNRTITRNGS